MSLNLDEFLELIENNNCPEEAWICLEEVPMSAVQVQRLARGLISANCPQSLTITFPPGSISPANVEVFIQELARGNWPQTLELNFAFNHIGQILAEIFARTISSGHCSKEFLLNLAYNDIGNAGAVALATAIASDNSPQILCLDLTLNHIGDSGAIALAQALNKERLPKKYVGLKLNHNSIGDAGAEALMQMLMGNTSVYLELDTRSFRINTIIEHCCLRNKLICEFPEFEVFIKKISAVYGLRPLTSAAPDSLKNIAGTAVIARQLQIDPTKIPQEVREFIEKLQGLAEGLLNTSKKPFIEKKSKTDEKSAIELALNTQDEVNRAKLLHILDLLNNHQYVLHKKFKDGNPDNSFSRSAKKVHSLVKEFLTSSSKNNLTLLTDAEFSKIAKKIRKILQNKPQASKGFFGIGTRHVSTADLYQKILDELDNRSPANSRGQVPTNGRS